MQDCFRSILAGLLVSAGLAMPAYSQFTLDDDGQSITVYEKARPVLTLRYRDKTIENPDGTTSHERAPYIHPLLGLNGEEVTGMPPSLWSGLPGISWGWSRCAVGNELIDLWNEKGVRRSFERWLGQEASEEKAELAFQSAWVRESKGDAPIMETVALIVLPAKGKLRYLDLFVQLQNVSYETILMQGALGQSGLALRLSPERDDWTLTGGGGRIIGPEAPILSPWVDCSYRDEFRSSYSGIAVLQHSNNPGYTHPNWTMDGEGVLVAAVHEAERFTLKPGHSIEFRYRFILHRGSGASIDLTYEYTRFLQGEDHPDDGDTNLVK